MPGDIGWRFLNPCGFARQTPRGQAKTDEPAGPAAERYVPQSIYPLDRSTALHLRRKKRADLGIDLIGLDADGRR
jgi:hypothetical protein